MRVVGVDLPVVHQFDPRVTGVQPVGHLAIRDHVDVSHPVCEFLHTSQRVLQLVLVAEPILAVRVILRVQSQVTGHQFKLEPLLSEFDFMLGVVVGQCFDSVHVEPAVESDDFIVIEFEVVIDHVLGFWFALVRCPRKNRLYFELIGN